MERNFEDDSKRGDKIRINITNLLEPVTRQEYITGIRFKWIPYIPLQNGKDKIFQNKTLDLLCDTETENCVKKFNNKHIIDVVPEYSYKISASYLTKVPYIHCRILQNSFVAPVIIIPIKYLVWNLKAK